MSTVLVTGSTGFIGSHLCRELVKQGNQVIGLSHSGKVDKVSDLIGKKNFKVRIADVTDKASIDVILKESRVKTIFHLAALVPYAQGDDLIGINSNGTQNILRSSYANGVEDFVYASSMGVYSTPPEVLPVPETHDTIPDTEYGQSKIMGELACKVMSKSMKVVIVRYAGAYGKGMEGNRVIPLFIRKALKNESLEVSGNGYQSSDFCHVEDIVRGTISAEQKGRSGEAYNIGSGHETKLIDLARSIVFMLRSESNIATIGDKIDRPFRFYLDISKARKELDYEPIPFVDGLRLFVRGMKRGI